MDHPIFPNMVTNLPEADIPFQGVYGWLLQGADHQLVFFDIEPIGVVPPHSHGDQWGIVLEGEVELTMNGETHIIGPGKTYFIPAGVEHSATFRSHTLVVDVFADVNRYAPKKR
jgi:quercetin dioxygenase-like cupin family protein